MRIDASRPLKIKAVCYFRVGQVESSATWQAADPLLGQCLELIVTVRVAPIYTSRPVLSQWGLYCCRESHHELLWLVLQIQVRGATDFCFLARHFFFAAKFFPQNFRVVRFGWLATPTGKRWTVQHYAAILPTPSTAPCDSYVFLWWTSLIWLFKPKVTERFGFLDGDRWWVM